MRPQVSPFFGIHYTPEERAEDGGGDLSLIEAGTFKQVIANGAIFYFVPTERHE